MAKYIINGGKPLKGAIEIRGCKNAALPILTAALLAEESSIITNIPDTSDVKLMAEIIRETGAIANQIDAHTWEIGGKGLKNCKIKYEHARKMRASILFIPAILHHCKHVTFPHPGGCVIGQRPLDTHLEALQALGVKFNINNRDYEATFKKPRGAKMFLDEVSVTATENAMMLAAVTPGETIIKPAACEPHVEDVANFLIQAGAKIEGAGSHKIKITGVDKLNAVKDYKVMPDNIEAGTYAIAAIATNGKITLKNITPEHMDPIVHKLKQMGAKVDIKEDTLTASREGKLKAARIQIDTWPRLPTDIQAPFGVLATQAEGTSLIHDWLYEKRLAYTDDLIRMGANITVCDPHRALITGPTSIFGTRILSPDLRAGIALVIAALIANGTSQIEHIELIDRGYEDLENRLLSLGADIKRED